MSEDAPAPWPKPQHPEHHRRHRGRVDAALTHARQSVALADSLDIPHARVAAYNSLALALADAGLRRRRHHPTRAGHHPVYGPGRPSPRSRDTTTWPISTRGRPQEDAMAELRSRPWPSSARSAPKTPGPIRRFGKLVEW
ncbi:MAG: hypothetical protein R2854_28615 [Caldilineaceae bacterium]